MIPLYKLFLAAAQWTAPPSGGLDQANRALKYRTVPPLAQHAKSQKLVIELPELCAIPRSVALTTSTTCPSHFTPLFYLCLLPSETHSASSLAIPFHQLLLSALFSSHALWLTSRSLWITRTWGHPFLCSLSAWLEYILFPFSNEIVKVQTKV